MARIELQRRVTQNGDNKDRQAFVMELTVVNAEGVDEEIFVFQRTTPTVQADVMLEPTDVFISVAEPVDLEDYPVDAPELESGMPYFRLATLTVKFRSLVALEETWGYINEDITGLISSINTGLVDPQTETVVFE